MNAIEAYQKVQEINTPNKYEYGKSKIIKLMNSWYNVIFFDYRIKTFLRVTEILINEIHQNTQETNLFRKYLYPKDEIFKSVKILKKRYFYIDPRFFDLAAEEVTQRLITHRFFQNMKETNPQKQYEYVKEGILKSVNIFNESFYDLDFQVSNEVAEMLTNEGYDIIPKLTMSLKLINRISWKNAKTDYNGNIIKGRVKEIGDDFTANDYLTFIN